MQRRVRIKAVDSVGTEQELRVDIDEWSDSEELAEEIFNKLGFCEHCTEVEEMEYYIVGIEGFISTIPEKEYALDNLCQLASEEYPIEEEYGEDACAAAEETFGSDYWMQNLANGAYMGEYATKEEWAVEFLGDTGFFLDKDDNVERYFDFEAYAKDAEMGGDLTFTYNNGLHVFSNHCG